MRITAPHTQLDSRAGRPRRGVAQIWFALMGLVMIGFLGLAVDAGYVVYVRNQLQSAADAAALAGAQQLYRGAAPARDAAVASINQAGGVTISFDRNDSNAAGGDVVLGVYDESSGVFDPNDTPANAVKVVAQRNGTRNSPVGLFLGAAFGVASMDIQRTATAVTTGIGRTAALAILDNASTINALDLSGGIAVDVAGGPVRVNSSADQAARLTGSASIEYDQMYIRGGYSGNFTPTPKTVRSAFPDPLLGLPEPDVSGRPTVRAPLGKPGPGEVQSLTPGYYPDGWDVQGTLNLEPGIYCIGNGAGGAALSANSQGVINGLGGVMLYVRGSISFNSTNTSLKLVPPDPAVNSYSEASLYTGIAIFQTRDRSHGVWDVSMPLSGSVGILGSFYYPYGRVNISATGTNDLGQMICWRFNGSGSGAVTIHYTGNLIPTAGPAYLVR